MKNPKQQDSSPEGIPVLLCANKTDLRGKIMENGDQQFVTSSEGAQLASVRQY